MAYYWGDYYRGDYYRGDYYRGDSWLSSLAASVGNFLPQSWTPSGARKVGLGIAGASLAAAGGIAAAPIIATLASKVAPYMTLGRAQAVGKAAAPVLAQTMHRIAPNAAASTSAPMTTNTANSVGVPSWLGKKKPKKRKKSVAAKITAALKPKKRTTKKKSTLTKAQFLARMAAGRAKKKRAA